MFREFRKLDWFFSERKKHYALALISLMTVNVITVLPPIIIGRAVDTIADGSATLSSLRDFMLTMGAITIAEGVLSYAWSYNLFKNAIVVEIRLRMKMMQKLLTMPQSFFERFSSGDLMARATSDVTAVEEMMGFGALAFFDGVLFLGTIILMMGFAVSWRLTFLSILPLPFLVLLVNRIGKVLHRFYTEKQEVFSKMHDQALEYIDGIRVIRSYVMERRTVDSFEAVAEEVYRKSLRTEVLASGFWRVTRIFSTLSYAIAVGFGVNMVVAGSITLGELISFNVYLAYLLWPMFAIGEFVNVAQRGTTSIGRIYEVLDMPDDAKTEERIHIDGIGHIRFEKYSFSYPAAEQRVLQELSVSVCQGKTLGIVGKTGSGKSTLLKQLLKQYPVGEGILEISGIPLSDIHTESLMAQIGYVSQENILFSKTIRENIKVGKEDATEEEISAIIKLADLDRDIAQFNDGLDTLVGERGIAVSGGQKQRISIARAIIGEPELLIMDDSLSAVDARTEARIIENIRKNRSNKTTIIVSHRLSALAHADEIIVLDDGRIIERGTHESLIAQRGWYFRQYEIQQMEEQDADE